MLSAQERAVFAALLRQFRRDAGLTQEALAERAGLGTRSIQGLESGENRPRRETVRRLAAALALADDERRRFEAAAQPAPRRRGVDRRRAASRDPRRGAGPEQPLGVVRGLFRVLPAGGAPGRSTEGSPTNLPLQLTSFIGREQEMAAIKERLAAARLLSLVGTGGCGKTRLASRVASDLLAVYRDGVWIVELASLADPSLVAQAVVSALGLREKRGQPLLTTLREHLRARELLLVLDNCEHLIGGCAELGDALLRSCPRLTILATGREALGLPGEAVWPVSGLALPAPDRPGRLEELAGYEAVQLFVERAAAVRPGFALSRENADAVAEVCWRLDGLPLALELAAAWVRTLPVGEIAARLGDAVNLLTLGGRTVPARHRSLRAALDWSHELLTDAERTLLRRLSVFAGGCTLAAAGQVCAGATGADAGGAGPTPEARPLVPEAVLDALDGLVAKSLVRAQPDGRYSLLEPVRQYAAEKLLAAEGPVVRDRHRDFYLALAEQAAQAAPGPIGRAPAGRVPERAQARGAWSERLRAEHDNLRTALGWCVERGDAERGLRIVAALGDFWHALALNREGSAWARAVLALPRPPGVSAALADALVVPAGLAWWLDDLEAPDAIREALEESLAIGRELADPAIAVRALRLLGQIQADPAETRRLFATALEEAERSGLVLDALWGRHGLACATFRAGDLAAARAMYEQNLRLARAAHEQNPRLARADGYLREIGASLEWLGNVALLEGDAVSAEALYHEALSAFVQAPDRFGEAHALQGLGLAARAQGDAARARALLTECLQIQRSIDDWQWLDGTLEGLAGLCDPVDASGAARAIRLAGAASAIRRRFSTSSTPGERGWIEHWLTPARDLLGADASAAVWGEGAAMSEEQAIAYALSDEP
jgi:predicted ATPase/transcriptional regulator with XRE-family HTH domain